MSAFPTPTPAEDKDDLRDFFDALAADPSERHGPADALLQHRLRILDRHAQFSPSDVVLDVGCGDGAHLEALADDIDQGIGVDLSHEMIATARQHAGHPDLCFRVDDAETLSTVPAGSVNKVICVGVLEHVLRPGRVLTQVARVLKPGGRFLALTLNGTYWWYRLADRLGLPTRHLSTDRRLRPAESRQLLEKSGLTPEVGFWDFVPSGDLPGPLPTLCRFSNRVGRQLSEAFFQGGLRLQGHLARAPCRGRPGWRTEAEALTDENR